MQTYEVRGGEDTGVSLSPETHSTDPRSCGTRVGASRMVRAAMQADKSDARTSILVGSPLERSTTSAEEE
jgi:hypothetical protein